MMIKKQFKIKENKKLVSDIFSMVLVGDTSDISAPGQFINISLQGFYLRRPISICDWSEGQLTIIYKTVGKGTEKLSSMMPGHKLEVLSPLGNGYNLESRGSRPIIVGGGVGVPPMYGLAKRLVEKGVRPDVILGFNTQRDVFYEKEWKALGLKVAITTVDGSYGIKGFVTDAMNGYDYAYACGPEPMLKAVSEKVSAGQFSFEARMACGFGGCMGCTCETKYGYKRICKEGPVLEKEEILW